MNCKPANLILPVLMAFPLPCVSQLASSPSRAYYYPDISGTASRNYVLEYTSYSGDEYCGVTKVTYLDGMGRPVESVTGGIAPPGTDIVEAFEYDALGRQSRKWLGAPFANQEVTGYVPLSSAKAAVSSCYSDAYPYSSSLYEPFRSGKIISEQRPGELSRQADAAQTYSYSANDAASPSLSCQSYTAVSPGDCDVRVTDRGVSPFGVYMVRHVVDYDGSETYEFTGCNGQRRRYGGKELDRTHGLDWYYYGARWYDAALCRWTTRDALEDKYPWLSAYGFCADDPVNNVDPDGNKIVGVNKVDASYVVSDLRSLFPGNELSAFRDLIRNNGKNLQYISNEDLSKALSGVSLSADLEALLNIVVNTINSSDKHIVKYLFPGMTLPNMIANTLLSDAKGEYKDLLEKVMSANNGIPASFITSRGNGVTKQTSYGSYSVIYDDGKFSFRAVLLGHELLGHGRSLALGRKQYQNQDAIQLENLLYRILRLNMFNDGTNHGEYLPNAGDLPDYR